MSYIGTEPKDIRSFGRTKFDYTATQGQTAFTGADDDGKVLAFTEGQIEVYVNGILMDDSDFTTTGTGTVTLASAANLNDVINIVSFESNIPDNDYVPASGGTFSGAVTHSGAVTLSGDLTVDTNALFVDASANKVGINTTTLNNALNVESASYQALGIKRNTGVTTGTGEFAIHMETNSQTTMSYDDEGSVVFGTASTPSTAAGFSEKVRIDSSGRVTIPNQPSFSYTSNNAWSISTTTQEKFTSSNVFSAGVPAGFSHNTGGHFNASTGTFTAPIAGRYKFHVSTTLYNFSSGYFYIYIYVNNNASAYKQFSQQSATMAQGVIDIILDLSANDYVDARWINNYTTPVIIYTTFSGYLLG